MSKPQQVLARIGGYSTSHHDLVGTDPTSWTRLADCSSSNGRSAWNAPVGRRTATKRRMRKSVSMDGGMVQVRGEGWKELKVGVVGTFLPPWELSESDAARSQDLHYTAQLGGVEAFCRRLVAVGGPAAGTLCGSCRRDSRWRCLDLAFGS